MKTMWCFLIKTSKADIMETDKPINMHQKYLFSIVDVI